MAERRKRGVQIGLGVDVGSGHRLRLLPGIDHRKVDRRAYLIERREHRRQPGIGESRPCTRVSFRFAPSPNGYLHLGHAYSALLNDDMARELGGRLLLRIEDIDAARCRPEYEAAIYEDLRWLGIAWQQDRCGGRASISTITRRPWPSSKRRVCSIRASRAAARSMRWSPNATGAVNWPRDPDGVPLYPGRARALSRAERERRRAAGEPFALRLAMDAAVARAGVLTWSETGIGPARPDRPRHRGAANVGRRRAGAQGNADQLSPRRRRR